MQKDNSDAELIDLWLKNGNSPKRIPSHKKNSYADRVYHKFLGTYSRTFSDDNGVWHVFKDVRQLDAEKKMSKTQLIKTNAKLKKGVRYSFEAFFSRARRLENTVYETELTAIQRRKMLKGVKNIKELKGKA